MIQRLQSVWLLLAAVFDAITFRFPFYVGDWVKDSLPGNIDLNAQTTFWLTILTVIIGGLAFVNIFLFSNRKLQLRLTFFGIALSAGLLVVYFLEMQKFTSGGISLWCLFYFAIFVFFVLAARNIIADQKLIKGLDRLR